MIVCTVLYKNDAEFDYNDYLNRHQPLFIKTMTPLGMKSTEARRVLGTADGSNPSCQVVASIYFDSMAEFQAAMQHPDTAKMIADIQNFFKGTTEILVTEVLG